MRGGLANLEAGDIAVIDVSTMAQAAAFVDRAVWFNGQLCFLRDRGGDPLPVDRVPNYRGEVFPADTINVDALVADPRFRRRFESFELAVEFVKEFVR